MGRPILFKLPRQRGKAQEEFSSEELGLLMQATDYWVEGWGSSSDSSVFGSLVYFHPPRVCLGSLSVLDPYFFQCLGRQGNRLTLSSPQSLNAALHKAGAQTPSCFKTAPPLLWEGTDPSALLLLPELPSMGPASTLLRNP